MSGTMTSILTLRRPALLFTRAHGLTEQEKGSVSRDSPERGLLRFEDLPEWYQDNPSVHSAYRPVSYSSIPCLHSLTYLHNETLNIYTHLIPAVLSIFVQIYIQNLITHHFPRASARDRLVFSAHVLAGMVTMFLSTCYHTLMNHSFEVSSLFLRIDYVGIITLTLGSFFSGIFVGFYCEPFLQRVYWTMIITLSLATSVLVLHPQLQGLRFRSHRTTAFVATGLSGFAPIGHGLWLYGWQEMWVRSGMPYWFLEGIVYGLGAFFFATRFPESKWPGKFDVWFCSHQIFHILVVCASVVHLKGVWDAYAWNYHNNHQCVVMF
ncbi:HlyIII-domain-containing protein [Acephala macrosclerotiorum]|nr:HlyIII-domain-containing protein [Acephala macrosclerotiorum]